MQNLKPRRYSNLSTARIRPALPFLDQVQEAQAAIAVFLGDRDHQPQVAFGQAALGFLVVGVDYLEVGDAAAQAAGRFLGGAQDCGYSLSQGWRSLAGRRPGGDRRSGP